MATVIVGLVLVVVGVGTGWYLKGKFGAKVAADVAKVETTAKAL